MEKKCINCGGLEFGESVSYPGVNACNVCGFLIGKMSQKINIILPEDPNDAVMCESCQ